MNLKWREIYSTGIDKIDEQHKHLFELITEIYQVPMHEKGIKLKEHVQALLDYADYHFKEEEEYWKKINLPQDMVDHHRIEHKNYSIQLNNIIKNSSTQNIMMSMATLDFLKDWVIDHMLGEDKEYVKYKGNDEIK